MRDVGEAVMMMLKDGGMHTLSKFRWVVLSTVKVEVCLLRTGGHKTRLIHHCNFPHPTQLPTYDN
eukprot:3756832-Ditylum_brightwellii.AAC.1